MAEIIFATGCFWGAQDVFDHLNGVIKTQVGYIGGEIENPSYEQVCSDLTGHAEAVKIEYDPKIISLAELLDVFFQSHDPTTLNKQGPDVGSQYRSAIFYSSEGDKKVILRKKEEYQKYFSDLIVTECTKGKKFYPAEEYHQNYFEKNGRSCFVDVGVNEEMWRKKLGEDRYHVMRQKGTEAPFSGEYVYFDKSGVYRCAACGQALFDSHSKFQTECGWPGFDKAMPGAIKIQKDFSHYMIRDEVVCARCGSHLGHLFDDGPTETGKRFCINSICLDFEKN